MKNSTKLWHDLVRRFAEQSTCKSRQVGAVIVKDNFVIAEGWNSPPGGCKSHHCGRPKCIGIGESGHNLDQAICAHAEANAISNCARRGVSTLGSALYCTNKPCAECAKLIVGAGIVRVSFIDDYKSPITDLIFNESNVEVGLLTIL